MSAARVSGAASLSKSTSTRDPLRPYLLPAIAFVVALMLFAWRLWVPEAYIYDEVYHAYTAGQYAVGNADAYVWYTHAPRPNVAYMWNHPPAGLLLLELGILIFGDNSFGWRIASAVFGALGVMLAFLMALDLTRRRTVAVLAVIFLLSDGLYFVQSRAGMLDMFGVVFMISAFWCFYDFLRTPASGVAAPLMRTGLFLGLAIATKWNAAYPSFFLGVAAVIRLVAQALKIRRAPADPVARAGVRSHLVGVSVGLVLIPILTYFAAYIPFFWTGHTLSQWAELQKQILWYHSHLRESHTYQSHWWEWPLTLRPVWYYATFVNGRVAHIYANGTLVLYAAFVPAVVWACVRGWKLERNAALILAIGFFGQWLPWALVPRISFIYHFLPSAVFGCLALAWVTADLLRRGGWRKAVGVGYVALVLVNFAYFLPIRAAIPMSPEAIEHRMWFKRWR